MKVFGKIKLIALVSVLLSGTVFAAVNQAASDLATKLYCDARGTNAPLTEQQAAQQAATNLAVTAGTQILVDTSCRVAAGTTGSGANAGTSGAAAGGSVGTGAVAAFDVTTAAAIVGGVLVLAAVASSGGGGDDTPASP